MKVMRGMQMTEKKGKVWRSEQMIWALKNVF